ncbi:hypothetical protein CDL15_Pgr024065 [Punica granatum]|uniref:Very-long-chain (3R)-3-hydroxyacyl-CoA dehydratase n=1 Tax=Punica granatum TaxID=22663 RepID=A0A218XWW0_PUNGR|nr:hypothetical protein CDL15_Pgr024065 [Punica granatum]
MSSPVKLYLLAYNSLQTIGWAVSLCRILISLATTKSVAGSYAAAGDLICLLQTVAFMEVLHGALGRSHFSILYIVSPSFCRCYNSLVRADSDSHVHFASGNVKALCQAGYTAFIVLYPLGMAPGEMLIMIKALPIVKMTNLYADFFSGLPFNYYDFLRVLLLVYPFLWLKLYLHLFKQRRSKLGKSHRNKKE